MRFSIICLVVVSIFVADVKRFDKKERRTFADMRRRQPVPSPNIISFPTCCSLRKKCEDRAMARHSSRHFQISHNEPVLIHSNQNMQQLPSRSILFWITISQIVRLVECGFLDNKFCPSIIVRTCCWLLLFVFGCRCGDSQSHGNNDSFDLLLRQ